MAIKSNAAKREAGKVSANKNTKATVMPSQFTKGDACRKVRHEAGIDSRSCGSMWPTLRVSARLSAILPLCRNAPSSLVCALLRPPPNLPRAIWAAQCHHIVVRCDELSGRREASPCLSSWPGRCKASPWIRNRDQCLGN